MLIFLVTFVASLISYGIRIHLEPLIQLIGTGESTIDCFHGDCWINVQRYVNSIYSVLKPQGRILMYAFAYKQAERNCKTITLELCSYIHVHAVMGYIINL